MGGIVYLGRQYRFSMRSISLPGLLSDGNLRINRAVLELFGSFLGPPLYLKVVLYRGGTDVYGVH